MEGVVIFFKIIDVCFLSRVIAFDSFVYILGEIYIFIRNYCGGFEV